MTISSKEHQVRPRGYGHTMYGSYHTLFNIEIGVWTQWFPPIGGCMFVSDHFGRLVPISVVAVLHLGMCDLCMTLSSEIIYALLTHAVAQHRAWLEQNSRNQVVVWVNMCFEWQRNISSNNCWPVQASQVQRKEQLFNTGTFYFCRSQTVSSVPRNESENNSVHNLCCSRTCCCDGAGDLLPP